ncbi:MAG TPA: hypothetical protein VEQ85_12770 [Lacipirellulaceae bacterium]|nr:hypothetical protein [Lacipirellulaceae bacterium]
MSLSSELLSQLRSAAGQRHQSLRASAGPRVVRVQADECQTFAATVLDMVLETPELSSITPFELQAASAALAQRVNYLLEPIAPIELDAQGCTVQMRSNPPQQDDNGRRYYELVIRRGGSIALCRFEKQPGQPRTRVPAVLTHEVVGRLIDDFSSTLDSL